MNTVAGSFAPKSRMGKAIVYTYSLLPRLSRYVLDGRYDIDIRNWLEDTLKRLPTEKDITMLLPENWQPVTAK